MSYHNRTPTDFTRASCKPLASPWFARVVCANPLVRDLVRENSTCRRLHPAALRPSGQTAQERNRVDAGQLSAQRRSPGRRSRRRPRPRRPAFILFGIPAAKDAAGSSALRRRRHRPASPARPANAAFKDVPCSSPTNASASTPITAIAASAARQRPARRRQRRDAAAAARSSASATPRPGPTWSRRAA